MKNIRQGSFLRLVLRFFVSPLLAVAALTLSGAVGQAQSQSGSKSGPASTAAARAMKKDGLSQNAGKGTHTGITVHGHWLIEVRNRDGKIVARREFENSLVSYGALNLALLLSGWEVPGGLYVTLSDPTSPTMGSPCQGAPNPLLGAGSCYITQPAPSYPVGGLESPLCSSPNSGPCSNNLALSIGNSNTGLVLSGSILATQAGNVGAVGSFLETCSPTASFGSLPLSSLTPAQCGVGTDFPANTAAGSVAFTAATLPSPVSNIQPGQIVAVTVTITFSSGS
jgi:hypothetical protein